MARAKKNRYETLRPPGEASCCIACGVCTTFSAELGLIFEEREEWKLLEGKLAVVRSEDIESTYFQNEPWLWTSFTRASQLSPFISRVQPSVVNKRRAVLYDPYTEHLRIAGITQHRMTRNFEPDPVPRNPQKARIGGSAEIPSKGFDRFLLVNMLRPELSDKNGLLGHLIHAHCWVLLDRVIGHKLVERELKIFVNAVQQFWKENQVLWKHDQFDNNYDDSFDPFRNHLRGTSYVHSEKNLTRYVDTSKNPVVVPEIQTLINQAVRDHSENKNDDILQRSQHARAFDVPTEIAMMIVNVVYNDIYYSQASMGDLQSMLIAFQWKLPDSYWQNRCKKDLIFEVDDLIRSESNQMIDWQFLCLNIDELVLRDGWYDNGGLKNRGRTLQLLQGLKKTFLEMIKQQDGA